MSLPWPHSKLHGASASPPCTAESHRCVQCPLPNTLQAYPQAFSPRALYRAALRSCQQEQHLRGTRMRLGTGLAAHPPVYEGIELLHSVADHVVKWTTHSGLQQLDRLG